MSTALSEQLPGIRRNVQQMVRDTFPHVRFTDIAVRPSAEIEPPLAIRHPIDHLLTFLREPGSSLLFSRRRR